MLTAWKTSYGGRLGVAARLGQAASANDLQPVPTIVVVATFTSGHGLVFSQMAKVG
jgi:hypothetical protein